MNQFITHSTKRNGKDYPTYSIEYSYEYKHCYWVAYRFDNTTGGSVGPTFLSNIKPTKTIIISVPMDIQEDTYVLHPIDNIP